MTGPRHIVIAGNGIAGVTAADTLRVTGYDGAITLVGDEPHPAYSRPALSKALLRDDGDPGGHLLPRSDHGASELLGVSVAGLDVAGRTVLLGGGDRLSYDALVIATGCRARRLGGPGTDEVTLRTVEDAHRLRARLTRRPAVVVVGGGPLGMEIASACLDAGSTVTLVSQGPPLDQQLGIYLSELLTTAARERGLRVVTTDAARLAPGGGATRVVLADGTVLEADLVVTAAGDVPNVEWLATSGLLHGGALVTDQCGWVRPGIVAAGDVAHVPSPLGPRRTPLWSTAIERSRIAATSLLGEAVLPADRRPYFWTEQFGLTLKAVGALPLTGVPVVLDGDPRTGSALLQWPDAAVALNYRIPIPRLRRLREAGPVAG